MAGQYAKPRSKDKETVVAAWTPSWTLHASMAVFEMKKLLVFR